MALIWRTASTTLPEPASPLVRIIAAPSPMRRNASPRLRAPQTNGTEKRCLLTWKCSSYLYGSCLLLHDCVSPALIDCPITWIAWMYHMYVMILSYGEFTLLQPMNLGDTSHMSH